MFVHLHRHSEFSLLDGIGNAEQYAKQAAELGQPALALTDHGTLSGALHHIKACGDVGILPISGVEAYYKPDRHQQDADHKENWHMVLLAKNLKGWRNLMRITSEAYQSGFYYKPCIDNELLEKYKEGLIATSACIGSWIGNQILLGNWDKAEDHIKYMLSVFGDDFYIEIMPHDFEEQRIVNIELIRIANLFSIPLIATVDAHYPYKEWAETQDVALMIGTGQDLKKREIKREKGDEVYEFNSQTLYIMSEDDVREAFSSYHVYVDSDTINSCINNTGDLVASCDFYSIDRSPKLPRLEGGEERAGQIIREWCEEGLERICKKDDEEYRKRFEYEFEIIQRKGVLTYFYIIGDAVRWAKSEGIRIGPGRGSAAGCLISYLVGITAIDPIGYGLLFERFLNPDRKGLPDIDIDIQHNRRDDVKKYVALKHGKSHVADVVTHQTYGPRSALQDVSRVLCIPYDEVMRTTKSIDEKTEDNLQQIIEGNETLNEFSKKYPEVFEHAIRLEGQVKAISKHAAAVVIADRPIPEYMPTMRAKNQEICTAWSDRPEFPIITDFGFLKVDFLSTDGLTKQQEAIALSGKNIDLDELPVCKSPYNVEQEVMEIFRKGLNLGVFQFEGRGITQLLRRIKPDHVGDITAANALYRPGPLEGGIAALYGKIKNGEADPMEWHESVNLVMQETYGLIIFQEQIMNIVQKLAGFSGGDADDFRKAIGKLYRLPGDEAKRFMNQYRERWFDGTARSGIDHEIAEDIWNKILAFGGYGFNKSHSACYSVQAYQDAWIKKWLPKEFYSSLLSHEPEKAWSAIREGQNFQTNFLPPHINYSDRYFNISSDGIRFGLVAVKNVGDVAINSIAEYRPFKSVEDFRERVPKKKCNIKVLNSLIKSGAFDEFGARDSWSLDEMAEGEKESIGISLSIPIQNRELLQFMDEFVTTEEEFESLNIGDSITTGGEIIALKKIITKKGEPMAFVDIAHRTNQFSCTIFPRVYDQVAPILETEEPILVKGRKDDRGAIIVNYACTASALQASLQA